MELDERLRWFEGRVTSSLKPRAEELKQLLTNEDSRSCMVEFCNNDEIRHIFVFFTEKVGRTLVASTKPPIQMKSKAIFFVKLPGATKITTDNIWDSVTYVDCSSQPFEYFEALFRDIYLPLLSTDQSCGISSDKLMDIMHRLVSSIQIMNGNVKGGVVLPLPSIEVLSDAAAHGHRRLAVIHVLETTLITWIKQIKNALKLDLERDIYKYTEKNPSPNAEVEFWTERLEVIQSLNEQLCSPVAVNILMNLEEAQSTYAWSFHNVKKEIAKAEEETEEQLKYLNTMVPWFIKLENARDAKDVVKSLKPIMRLIFLSWEHSGFYHQTENITRMLKMISNEVVRKAKELVGPSVLDDLLRSHTRLRQALHVCASFRGLYLDTKDRADHLNKSKLRQIADMRTENVGIVWHSKMYKDAKTPKGGHLFTMSKSKDEDHESNIWTDSPWPARNSHVFNALNAFMERCNDVLELVETTRHFQLLSYTAEVGGAGSVCMDAVVREIHSTFLSATEKFQKSVEDVLDVSETQSFEKSFFVFRSVIREMETRLGEVLHQSFKQCWDTTSRLRLLEVFEGTSSRVLVQEGIKSTVDAFVFEMTEEVQKTTTLFRRGFDSAPYHSHLPPVVNELLWLESLKARLEEPLAKLRIVSPWSLKGDDGWRLRDAYADLLLELERTEQSVFQKWQKGIEPELYLRLQHPVLLRTVGDDGKPVVQVNLDSELERMIRESHYVKRLSRKLPWPDRLDKLITTVHPDVLRLMAARLGIVASRYNDFIRTISDIERPLFEKKLEKVDWIIEQGTSRYCWKDAETSDFVEDAVHTICDDVHKNISIIQGNETTVKEIVSDWVAENTNSLTFSEIHNTLCIEELDALLKKSSEDLGYRMHLGSVKIKSLVDSSFEAVLVGQASPAWCRYLEFIDQILVDGLKQSAVSSLSLMLNRMIASRNQLSSYDTPVLTIRMELIGSEVTFSPPLDETSSVVCLREYLQAWLDDILNRSTNLACNDEKYKEAIKSDDEVQDLLKQLTTLNEESIKECKEYLQLYKNYAFLWLQDVKMTFDEFLKGNISSKPRDMSRAEMVRSRASLTSTKSKRDTHASSSRTSSVVTSTMSGVMGLSERAFLISKKGGDADEDQTPTLDDFDKEIEIYKNAKEEIAEIAESVNVGWICLNMQPIKKTLETYTSKWMFTFMKYLSDQISGTLSDFDTFLKRIEPGVEAITGQERDIASFMKLMRIFNEVSAKQAEFDSKFIAMKRSISILDKYKQKLPQATEKFYKAAPSRWNNLKMKVNQAKQRLGPRIQAEAEKVTETLEAFGKTCRSFRSEFNSSEALNRRCNLFGAHTIMDSFQKRLDAIKTEAQDLVELQELLEKDVADFSILQSIYEDLGHLRQVWNVVKSVQEHHTDWKRHRWQKIRSRTLKRLLDGQLEQINNLPSATHYWDVVIGLQETVSNIQACVPFMEDLGKAAMRTRHWKQLVRVTGGAVNITNEGLNTMTLAQFLDLGLQNHADEVTVVVQRASKDLVIENTLKTYEEVWLSKIFELKKHTQLAKNGVGGTHESPGSEYGADSEAGGWGRKHSSSRMSIVSLGLKAESRMKKGSFSGSSLNHSSLIHLSQDYSDVHLLKNVEPILEELESHQISLQLMLDGGAASSFLDDIKKWQRTLQNIESVLTIWIKVQSQWIEMSDIFTATESKIASPHESSIFATASREFVSLMKRIEKNSNVLQACTLPNINIKLEKLDFSFGQCRGAIMSQIDRRRQKFPRLYFLPMEDVTKIVCLGYDPVLVGQYIHKVYRNIGSLEVDVTTADEQKYYQILGISSLTREQLYFEKPLVCENGIESWLTTLDGTISRNLKLLLSNLLSTAPDDDKLSECYKKDYAASDFSMLGIMKDVSEALELPFILNGTFPVQTLVLALKVIFSKFKDACVTSGDLKANFATTFKMVVKAIDVISLALQNRQRSKAIVSPASRTNEIPKHVSTSGKERTKQVKIDDKGKSAQSFSHLMNGTSINTRDLHRVRNILVLLLYEQQTLSHLVNRFESEESLNSRFSESFAWNCLFQYKWDAASMSLKVSTNQVNLEYNYDYQGTQKCFDWTPILDQSLYHVAKAVHECRSVLLYGNTMVGKKDFLMDLSLRIGHPLFFLNCTHQMNNTNVLDICKGIGSSGCWVCFQNVNYLKRSTISFLSQLSSLLLDEIATTKSSCILGDEEINLTPNGRLFLTTDPEHEYTDWNGLCTNFKVSRSPKFPSHLHQIPEDLLKRQRVVSGPNLDLCIILQTRLILSGFNNYLQLSRVLGNLMEPLEQVLCLHNRLIGRKEQKRMHAYQLLCGAIPLATHYLRQVLSLEDSRLNNHKVDVLLAENGSNSGNEEQEVAQVIHTLDDEQETALAVDIFVAEQQALVLALKDIFLPFFSVYEEELLKCCIVRNFKNVDYNYSLQQESTFFEEEGSVSVGFRSDEEDEHENIEDIKESEEDFDQGEQGDATIEEVITMVATELNLVPGKQFMDHVIQLRQLSMCHGLIFVTGKAASGKSSCIDTFLACQEKIGYVVKQENLWPSTVLPDELFGCYDTSSRRWKPGMFPIVLDRLCQEAKRVQDVSTEVPHVFCLRIDGQVHCQQRGPFADCFSQKDVVTMPNGEAMKLPDEFLCIWETEDLDQIPPQLIFSSGLLHIGDDVVTWNHHVERWLLLQPESRREYLTTICERYIQPTIDVLFSSKTSHVSKENNVGEDFRFVIPVSIVSMLETTFSIFKAAVSLAEDVSNVDLENYFNYAILWGFGGCLDEEDAMQFGIWWQNQWSDYVKFPKNVSVWETFVHPESHEFFSWDSALPAYTGLQGKGIPEQAFAPTSQNMAILHLISILSESGKPVMLIGEAGCGKSEIILERFRSQSAEVAEVLTLTVKGNTLLGSKELFERLNRCLEWKHSKLYIPKGGKKLMCLIDDISLVGAREGDTQTACEMMRQLLSQQGCACTENWTWQQIEGVSFFSTYNPNSNAHCPNLSQRMTRHWNAFHFHYPAAEEQRKILGLLVKAHFHGSSTNMPPADMSKLEILSGQARAADKLTNLLNTLINVSVEMRQTLREMFLPTPERCYYLFSMETLITLFRNFCRILKPSSSVEDILSLWINECHWIFGHYMDNKVDYERWKQAFQTVCKKTLNKQEMETLSAPAPFVTSLFFDDSVNIKAGVAAVELNKAIEYVVLPAPAVEKVEKFVSQIVSESNKDNPRIKLITFPSTVRLLNRLVSIIQSPYKCGHALILAKGAPSLAHPLVQTAAYICGFTVFRINPSKLIYIHGYTREHFMMDLLTVYQTAGVKREKILLTLDDTDIQEAFLVYISELLLADSITHFFNSEEETSITNAIRTDVTQAGLTFSKEVAWNFFLKTVKENLRVVYLVSETGRRFQRICREYTSLINAFQVITLQQWSFNDLVTHAQYLLKDLSIISHAEQENIAHLLASMHSLLGQNIPKNQNKRFYLTNCTFQKLVERFIYTLQEKHAEISLEHDVIMNSLGVVKQGSDLATQLSNRLDHERIVLEQKRMGNSSLLNQIGQDKAISEEQIRLVEKQQRRIEKLKKLLPKYEEAHERAVFKAAAMVKETKHVLKELDHSGLANLRALQKPDSEIEDLLAAVIIIVKSPTSDLTWNKGAKRIMANLERFQEDLAVFDEIDVPETTLQVAETYIAKPHFTPGYLENRTNNPAIGSLVLWVRGVVRYHRMMLSRVTPLHVKVQQTIQSIDDAVQKMSKMQDKLKDLGLRLSNLSNKFEEASVDKSQQGQLTEKQGHQLERAGLFENSLSTGQERWKGVLDSINHRLAAIVGNVAISSAFYTYLGSFNSEFRKKMIFEEWPKSLDERGIELDFDMLENITVFSKETEGEDARLEEKEHENVLESNSSGSHAATAIRSQGMDSSYDTYCQAVIKLMIGNDIVRSWMTKGIQHRQLENLSIMYATRHHVLLLNDPFNLATSVLHLLKVDENEDFVEITMSDLDPSKPGLIEQAVAAGNTLVVHDNYRIDAYFYPIIEILNTRHPCINDEAPTLVKINGRRLFMHPSFKIVFILRDDPRDLMPTLVSSATFVDLRPGTDKLMEEFCLKSLSRMDPEAYSKVRKCHCYMFKLQWLLETVDQQITTNLRVETGTGLWEDTGHLTSLVERRKKYGDMLRVVLNHIKQATQVLRRFERFSFCAVTLFSLLQSFTALGQEYKFSLAHFQDVFDDAVGGTAYTMLDDFNYHSQVPQNTNERSSSSRIGKTASRALVGVLSTEMEQAQFQNITKVEGDAASMRTTDFLIHEDVTVEDLADLNTNLESSYPDQSSLCRTFIQKFYGAFARSFKECEKPLFRCMIWLLRACHASSAIQPLVHCILTHESTESNIQMPSKYPKPDWINDLDWNYLCLQATTLPILDNAVSALSKSPTTWQEWYISESPWFLPPGILSDIHDNWILNEGYEKQDGSSYFDQMVSLLLIKYLRPDSLKTALQYFAAEALRKLEIDDLDTLAVSEDDQYHVLTLILKTSLNTYGPHRPDMGGVSQRILAEAKRRGMDCLRVQVHEGSEQNVDINLNTAIQTECWLLIEDIEFGSKEWLVQFSGRLLRLLQQTDPKFRIFMTYQAESAALPSSLLHECSKVSWHCLVNKDLSGGHLDVFSFDNVIQSINIAFEAVCQSTWDRLKEEPLSKRSLAFTLCIYHGILLTVQRYIPRTLTQILPLNADDVNEALNVVLEVSNTHNQTSELVLRIPEGIYESKSLNGADKELIKSYFKGVLRHLQSDSSSFLYFGDWSIPIPPANVDPRDYKNWLVEKLQEHGCKDIWQSLAFSDVFTRSVNKIISDDFIVQLRMLFERTTMDHHYNVDEFDGDASFRQVKQAVDMCLDHLPESLELKSFGRTKEYYFTSYCMEQECLAYNKDIARIKASIQILHRCLIGGIEAMSPKLIPHIYSLASGVVPVDWISMGSAFPATTVKEWLVIMNKRRNFLKQWIEHQQIATPIHLTVLSEPSAMVNALQCDAVSTHTDITKISWCGRLLNFKNTKSDSFRVDKIPQSITFTGFSLVGSSYDLQKGLLMKQRPASPRLPRLALELTRCEENASSRDQSLFSCPVYSDLRRIQNLFCVPLRYEGDLEIYTVGNAAIILQDMQTTYLT